MAFPEDYTALMPGEQAQFSEALRILMAEGLIWREDESKRGIYSFLYRHTELVKGYLEMAGWQLIYHEQSQIFQVIHRDGAHRKRLNQNTTIWLLLLRMLYAEQQESKTPRLTRYPAVTIGDISHRYQELPHAKSRQKGNMEEALRQLQQSGLLHVANGGSIRANNTQQVIELLPTLEVVVPANNVQQIAEQLSKYFQNAREDITASSDDALEADLDRED